MMRSVHRAVGPLNSLGLKASFQNEGNAWETNWQEGKDHHLRLFTLRRSMFSFIVLSVLWLQVQPIAADQAEV